VVVNDPFIDADERGGLRWIFQPVPAKVRYAEKSAISRRPGVTP
jgi:hypothetical protein